MLLLCDDSEVVVTGDGDELAVDVGLDCGHSGVVFDEGEFSEALADFQSCDLLELEKRINTQRIPFILLFDHLLASRIEVSQYLLEKSVFFGV